MGFPLLWRRGKDQFFTNKQKQLKIFLYQTITQLVMVFLVEYEVDGRGIDQIIIHRATRLYLFYPSL